MCWCRPNVRTPFCGRPGCHPPSETPEQRLARALDNPVGWFFPQIDAWNHRFALHYVAQHLGLSSEGLRWVPTDAFAAHPDDPAPYFLPCGSALRPWLHPIAEKTPGFILDEICRKTGGSWRVVAGRLLFD